MWHEHICYMTLMVMRLMSCVILYVTSCAIVCSLSFLLVILSSSYGPNYMIYIYFSWLWWQHVKYLVFCHALWLIILRVLYSLVTAENHICTAVWRWCSYCHLMRLITMSLLPLDLFYLSNGDVELFLNCRVTASWIFYDRSQRHAEREHSNLL